MSVQVTSMKKILECPDMSCLLDKVKFDSVVLFTIYFKYIYVFKYTKYILYM